MTDQAKKKVQRRRKSLSNKRRKTRLLLLALALFLGSGAFLFHKEKFYTITDILSWLKQNRSGEVFASTSPSVARGNIYDRNFRPLAVTYKSFAIYARPLEMEDPASSANLLSEILGLKKNNLLQTLKSERGFVWVAKGIDQDVANTIQERNIKGIYQMVEIKRFYPNSDKASHAVGFVENGQGLDGIEFQYNTMLRGGDINRGELEALHFAPDSTFGESGTHAILNLDLMIQARIERFLEKRIKITGASNGAVLLLNAETGAILAMASYPSFNPNRYWEFPSNALSNHALNSPLNPGELALIFQQAAAINSKNEKKSEATASLSETDLIPVITPDKRKKRKMSVAPVVDAVEPEYFARFAKLLGFSQKPLTDLSLKDETPVSASRVLTDPNFSSSALRLLTGFTALVNGGRIVHPHLLQTAYPIDIGSPIEPVLKAAEQFTVLHPSTSRELTDFLAAKWLNMNRRSRKDGAPLFLEAHRFAAPQKNTEPAKFSDLPNQAGPASHLSQSVMLGAIPGKEPKLTMIAVLSYPEIGDEVYPDALETFGKGFSVLTPSHDMIKTMLHVAAMEPPKPSPNFWINQGAMTVKGMDPMKPGAMVQAAAPYKNRKIMPDVTAKSLRAGLQVLQYYNLEIKLYGSGSIVSQQPPAGTELKNGAPCILKMEQEI